ncbi:MAG TPA: fumarate hydratase, partial [Syntrophorhabdus aromaticivorans]|nr:fumarate hydratase [Syntrophorhabdus aromaticivorans]
MNTLKDVTVKTAETLVKASTSFGEDQKEAYQRAHASESNEHAKWVLETILQNAEMAEKMQLPLCDDTGIPHVLLEIGDAAAVPAGFLKAVEDGIASGLRKLPGRPMAVRGGDLERLSQSRGLYEDSGALAMAPV